MQAYCMKCRAKREADGIQERDIAVITARLYLRLETN